MTEPDCARGAGLKLLILAGEASADLQGANLVAALKRIAPALDIVAVGGPRMRAAGARVVQDSTCLSFIGMWEVVLKYPLLLSLYRRVQRIIRDERPDHVVLIDAPGFNMRLAPLARSLGIPTTYYFPPSAWSPSVERARRIADAVDHVVATFEFTADVYRKAGREVAFFGHPMADMPSPGTPAELRQRLALPLDKKIVAVLPGSRANEIRMLTPVLLESVRQLALRNPGLHFVVPIAMPGLAGLVRDTLRKHGADDLPLTVIQGQGTETMGSSDLVLMASGSASLEAALLGVPMVLIYRLTRVDWFLAPYFIKDFTFMGLPNLMVGEAIVPELLQDEARPERIVAEAEALLPDGARREKMKEDLFRVKKQLGAPGVVDRVAHHIWEKAFLGHGRRHHHQ
ncbi:MAG: lipid-A-disaccharide synthase [Armatimonadetes bacterium]|nr:lipid-A-disaccharide synthase [Armatimonadota bacterium]